jgi:hypothetical protein
MENVDIIYGHLEYLTAFWYALWPCGIFSGHLKYFPSIGMLYQYKSFNPLVDKKKNNWKNGGPRRRRGTRGR